MSGARLRHKQVTTEQKARTAASCGPQHRSDWLICPLTENRFKSLTCKLDAVAHRDARRHIQATHQMVSLPPKISWTSRKRSKENSDWMLVSMHCGWWPVGRAAGGENSPQNHRRTHAVEVIKMTPIAAETVQKGIRKHGRNRLFLLA